MREKEKKQKETYALVIEYNKMRMLMNSYDGLEEGEEEEEEWIEKEIKQRVNKRIRFHHSIYDNSY